MKKKVLVTYQMFRSGYAELMEKYDVTFPPEGRETFTYDEVYQMLPEYDALQSMFNFPVSRELLQRGLPRLRIVSNYAVGYELLELDNVVLTPHLGTQTFDVRNEMAAYVSRNIINFFEGGPITRVTEK